jgi:hypothetical protein
MSTGGFTSILCTYGRHLDRDDVRATGGDSDDGGSNDNPSRR